MATQNIEVDVLVVGGGTAGPLAAIKAKQKNPELRVLLLDKANVKRAGAIAEGMDSVNNAIIPGYATPEHLAALDRWGPCPLHRRTFSGVWRQGELFVLEKDD